MEYYCAMVKTGQEEAFKRNAMAVLGEEFPEVKYFFFQRKLRTNKGRYFDAPLFPGYIFFQIDTLSTEFFEKFRRLDNFCRILYSNENPISIRGGALDELKLFISNGERWGLSKVQFLPGKRVKAVSGPLVGLEGNVYMVNKKKHHITVISSLSPDGKKFDLLYEEAELVDEQSEPEQTE